MAEKEYEFGQYKAARRRPGGPGGFCSCQFEVRNVLTIVASYYIIRSYPTKGDAKLIFG